MNGRADSGSGLMRFLIPVFPLKLMVWAPSCAEWHQLKNGDRLRAAALLEVAERLDCESFLALADVHESWSCEDDDYGWGYREYRRNRDVYDYDDDDDEDDYEEGEMEEDSDSFTLTELCETEIQLRHWVDSSGKTDKSLDSDIFLKEVCYTNASVEFQGIRVSCQDVPSMGRRSIGEGRAR